MLNPANLLLEAADINTIPSRLRELATSSNELARVVALNPIAPPDLLAALAALKFAVQQLIISKQTMLFIIKTLPYFCNSGSKQII